MRKRAGAGERQGVKEMLTGSLSHFSRRHRPLSQVARVLISLLISSHYVCYLRAWHRLRYSRLTRYLCVFPHGTLSIFRDNLFLNSYMPCSVHFVGNRLLTSDILRLAISILFVSCRGRKPIETS